MSIVTGLLLYIIIWWVTFFMFLPIGVKVPEDAESGHATSAPEKPMIWRKVVYNSLFAAVVWGLAFLAIEQQWVSLDELAKLYGLE